jgi:hypothetical protein
MGLCARSGYAKLFGALSPHESARPAALQKANMLIRSSITGHSAGTASADHSDSERGAEASPCCSSFLDKRCSCIPADCWPHRLILIGSKDRPPRDCFLAAL